MHSSCCEDPFESTNYIQHIDNYGLEILEEDFSNPLDESKDGIDLGPITSEVYLRIVASMTPIFAVSPECSKASWTYFRNLLSRSGEWALQSTLLIHIVIDNLHWTLFLSLNHQCLTPAAKSQMESSQAVWTSAMSLSFIQEAVVRLKVLEPWEDWSPSRLETLTHLAALKDVWQPDLPSTLPIHTWIHLTWQRTSRAGGHWEGGIPTSTWQTPGSTFEPSIRVQFQDQDWGLVTEWPAVSETHCFKSWTCSLMEEWVE